MRDAARLDRFACRADPGHLDAGPTIRVEEGDRVRVPLRNTHYFPHTIHFHGTIRPNAMDGVPDFTQASVVPARAGDGPASTNMAKAGAASEAIQPCRAAHIISACN